MLRKARKFGYTTEILKVTAMFQNADNKLFSFMFRSGHCLHTLLPDLKMIEIVLRSSGTSLNLPQSIINCANDRSSIDVFLAIASDIFCCVLHCVFHVFLLLHHIVIFYLY